MAKVLYSADIQDLRGKMGNTVFSKARNGATSRGRVIPKNPRTTAQTAVRSNLVRSNTSLHTLTTAQVTAWQAFAAGQTVSDPVTGHTYSPAWNTVYNGLTTKFLQINPTGTAPTSPPAAPFGGDSISVTAAGATAQITFTGSAANATGMKTELLVQALKTKYRTPNPNGYRSKGFIAFTSGTLTANVALTPGWYAVAYRFVSTATGQETHPITLGMVQVS